jgi:hypothetical protein
MGCEVLKYDHPIIIVRDSRGRTQRFSVSDDGIVEDRGDPEFRRAAVRYLYSRRSIIPRRHKGPSRSHLTLRD